MDSRNKNKNLQPNNTGFTLIEVLVVVAVIALLSAVALVALQSGRQKSRDAKRLSDMTQMATAMELYFNTNKGYPSSVSDLVPGFTSSVPASPQPPDGDCASVIYPLGGTGTTYNYYPSPTGGSYTYSGLTVYPDYIYYFCLGNQTGNFAPGMHYVTPKGLR
jgi:prepilin-type N-terminal cleavage/methylation domain-containing protein